MKTTIYRDESVGKWVMQTESEPNADGYIYDWNAYSDSFPSEAAFNGHQELAALAFERAANEDKAA